MAEIDPIKSEREIKWLWVILWTGTIYASAAFVRPVCEYLRSLTMLNVTVTAVMGVFLLVFIGRLLAGFLRLPVWKKILLVAVLGMYVAGFIILKIPEERIHLFQYGVLAYLVFQALSGDFPEKITYGLAFSVTFLLGWGDEIVQSFTPGRFYDNKDVILNGVSGFLGLMLTYLRGTKVSR